MTPFAQLALQKQAGFNPAKLISKGMTTFGRAASNSAGDAGALMARNAIRESGGIAAVGGRNAASRMQNAGRLSGRHNSFIGEKLRRGGAVLGRSEGLQNAVNYGGGATIAGAGLYGANRMGHASGREAGIGEGLDAGMDAGLAAAQQNTAPQAGYLGGLWNALKGDAGGGGFNVGQAYGDLGNSRQALINQLMGRV